jgi:glycosyltransferase involved in cell wall biosynthesis
VHVLVVSNLYPPFFLGGYEIQCERVVNALRERGHRVDVLTSTYGLGQMRKDGDVYRTLSLSHPWYGDPHAHWIDDTAIVPYNYRVARVMYRHLRPEVVFFWSPLLLSLAPIVAAQRLGLPCCFYLSDTSLFRYQASDQPRWSRAIRRFLWRLPFGAFPVVQPLTPRTDTVRWTNVITCSRFVADALRSHGIDLGEVTVAHHAVDTERVRYRREYGLNGALRIVYAGQLVAHKGTHTLVEGFLEADRRLDGGIRLQLDLIGSGDEAYTARLRGRIAEAQRAERVRFVGRLPNAELANRLCEYDLFAFPSEWDEPFSIGLLEGMSAALPAVTTLTGGTAEVIRHRENALVFEPGNSAALAAAILELAASRELRERLGRQARRDVRAGFEFSAMVETIDAALRTATAARARRPLNG